MATKNLVGNPNGIIDNEFNSDVSRSGYSDGISPSHFFTMNEGEIKIQYDELLEPNSEIRIKNDLLFWQSPLVSRNLTNQKFRAHYFAQSIKNMWADWRSYIFGGRYGDFGTPELHFSGFNDSSFRDRSPVFDTTVAPSTNFFNFAFDTFETGGSASAVAQHAKFLQACKTLFATCFPKGSLGESLGFQADTMFTEINTPNPWPFMAYLNFYKWFVCNKYVLRGNTNFKKIWFPDNEDDFKFHTGSYNQNTGIIGRFFSPEFRSGVEITGCNVQFSFDSTDYSRVTVRIFCRVRDCSTNNQYYLKFIHDDGLFNPFAENSGYFRDHNISSSDVQSWIHNASIEMFSEFVHYYWEKLLQNGFPLYPLNSSGWSQTTPFKTIYLLDLFETRFMNFNKDYFTGGLISPLISGDYPKLASVGSQDISGLTAETTLSGGSVTSSVSHSVSGQGNVVDRTPQVVVRGANGVIGSAGIDSISQSSDEFSRNLKDAFDSILVSSELDLPSASTSISGSVVVSGSGFSIPDLRLLSATTEYLEALARSDGDYQNMVMAIYGVKPNEISEAPYFIGGSSGFIQTQNIFQTAPSSDSPLGTVTQTGFGGSSNYIGSTFVKDTTVILGVVSVVPEIFYYQGVPKKWVMRHKEEHQNPKFNGLSMQAIENREIFVSGVDSVDTSPFTYAPAWEFMRHRQNRLSGLMRPHFDSSTGVLLDKPFTQMTQSRGFKETPQFNEDFVSTKGNISTEHLYVTDTDLVPEFMCACFNQITEILPITKSGMPAKI